MHTQHTSSDCHKDSFRFVKRPDYFMLKNVFYIFIFKNYMMFLENAFLFRTFKYFWKAPLRLILIITSFELV